MTVKQSKRDLHVGGLVSFETGEMAIILESKIVRGLPELCVGMCKTTSGQEESNQEVETREVCGFSVAPTDCDATEKVKARINNLSNRQEHVPSVLRILSDLDVDHLPRGVGEEIPFINMLIHPMQIDPINKRLPEGVEITTSSLSPF